MDREELKQIIKQIIERDIENGDWFDVDTIAYDVRKKYPDVKTDTDEFYDLEIECIDEVTGDDEDEEEDDDLFDVEEEDEEVLEEAAGDEDPDALVNKINAAIAQMM